MKFGILSIFLLLIIEISSNLVKGKAITEEKNDCTKFLNFIKGDNKSYSIYSCCLQPGVACKDGYIIRLEG